MTVKISLTTNDFDLLRERTGEDFTQKAEKVAQGKVQSIRLSTIDLICKTLDIEPGDIFVWLKDATEEQLPSLEERTE